MKTKIAPAILYCTLSSYPHVPSLKRLPLLGTLHGDEYGDRHVTPQYLMIITLNALCSAESESEILHAAMCLHVQNDVAAIRAPVR